MALIRESPSGKALGSTLTGSMPGPISPGSIQHVVVHLPGAVNGDFMVPSVELPSIAVVFGKSLTDEVHCFVLNHGALPASNIPVTFQRFTDNRAPSPLNVESLWVGAPTTEGATIALTFNQHVDGIRARAFNDQTELCTESTSTYLRVAKFTFWGLPADTAFHCRVELDGEPVAGINLGSFRTLPSSAAGFTIAFSGDAANGSNHVVWDAIRLSGALLFQHLGDTQYRDIVVNDPALFRAAYDERLAAVRQSQLMRSMPVLDIWDDHDYGGDNSDGASPSRPAAVSTYRERVPHYPLPDNDGAIYYSYTVGRVLFIVTDQRSAASPSSMLDGPSKSMLGSAQRSWFESLIAASTGMVIVWICSRIFGGASVSRGDPWSGFGTERAALVSHIHTHAHGRVIVIAADGHFIGIDDGTNHDFLPGGGEPIPTFQAAPLDQGNTTPEPIYSEGTIIANGLFGTMEVIDSGGSSIDLVWRAHDSLGSTLITYPMTISL